MHSRVCFKLEPSPCSPQERTLPPPPPTTVQPHFVGSMPLACGMLRPPSEYSINDPATVRQIHRPFCSGTCAHNQDHEDGLWNALLRRTWVRTSAQACGPTPMSRTPGPDNTRTPGSALIEGGKRVSNEGALASSCPEDLSKRSHDVRCARGI